MDAAFGEPAGGPIDTREPAPKESAGLNHVEETIDSIVELHRKADKAASQQQRFIERVTRRIGSARTTFSVLALSLAWCAGNWAFSALHVHVPDPPPFYWLGTLASVGALIMTLFIVTTENRQGHLAERRAQLDLQVTLLTERKVTKLIALLEEFRRDAPGIHNREDPEANSLMKVANPHEISRALHERQPSPEDLALQERLAED